MERAGRALVKLKLGNKLAPDQLALAAWPSAVGKKICAHAIAIVLVRDRLVVEVEDPIWQKQLFHLRHQILGRLHEVLGDEIVRDLEFRLASKRKPPQTAVRIETITDDADRIEDPIMRRVYKEARRKASA